MDVCLFVIEIRTTLMLCACFLTCAVKREAGGAVVTAVTALYSKWFKAFADISAASSHSAIRVGSACAHSLKYR